MALQSQKTDLVADESLEGWKCIGSGGFGKVYKARHKDWGFDVAIKLIRQADGVLFDEASHMDKAACEFVLRRYGIYQGCPSKGESSIQQGIVMEFMERGSVQTLQKDLSGPPQWPLAFRLAHQVALGMNFLHSRSLLHKDLKPSNVLLNGDLNAKVADFGLSMISTSALPSNTAMTGVAGGSFKYMPPESFDTSYQPVRAFDRYSYGILLWSIVTSEEPYPVADYSLVALKIPMGDRPECHKIEQTKVEGLKELVDLMKKCWDQDPSKRPTFQACLKVTESVLSMHKKDIPGAVHAVLTKLGPPQTNQQNFTPQMPESPHDTVDHVRFPVQLNSASGPEKNLSVADKAKFVNDHKAELIQSVSEVLTIAEELGDMVHPNAYSLIEAATTSQAQMRVLYQRTFRSGGDVVKAAFYDVLKKNHLNLVERLGD